MKDAPSAPRASGKSVPVKRTPRRKRRGPSKTAFRVGGLIGDSFPHLAISARLREYRVKKLWPQIVGAAVSKRARPVRLIGDTLHCVVSSSAWMTELNYQKPLIMDKINACLREEGVKGTGDVKGIIFKPGSIKDEPAPAKAEVTKKKVLTKKEEAFIQKSVDVVQDKYLQSLIKRVMEKGH
ncbi:MAG: hypothetical protein BMS9Abin23_0618 [Thermodesulfobacteriota bacterium]|nr:MAG: hypothetical protein BMS9Abin23_0618 [Thermodesulfobacteriota bacterium]